MQYLVQVCGVVTDNQNKVYVVDSNSEEDAKILAKRNFYDDFSSECNVIYSRSQKRTYKAIVAFIFMSIPIFLSFWNWRIGVSREFISIRPDLTSCLFAIAIYSAFIVRFKGVQRIADSWIDIVFCVLTILLLATFVQMIIVPKSFSILWWKIKINTTVILIVATILSWVGLKFVSLICMAGVMFCALSNILEVSEAMKWAGPVYSICSFLGMVLYLSVEPAFIESMIQFKHSIVKSIKCLSNDFIKAKGEINSFKTNISQRIETKK